MPLEPGTRLGPYQVTEQIGAGGMGEVYRARDTSLDRDVAIKVLPAEFASDPERLARFEREAKVLASLNHPNIAQIHGLERSGDTPALVLEYVEGPTLADMIAASGPRAHGSGSAQRDGGSGPKPGALSAEPARRPQGLPLDEALPIAKQIAEALEAAHEQGIIQCATKVHITSGCKLRPSTRRFSSVATCTASGVTPASKLQGQHLRKGGGNLTGRNVQ